MDNNTKIGIIGLGYVGLPLACLFAERYQVTGFDKNKERTEALRNGKDDTEEVDLERLETLLAGNLAIENDEDALSDCNVYIICVPTPVDSNNNPELSPLKGASRTVGKYLKKDDVVVYESSVYPGCTENNCVPVLEGVSGLEYNRDFFVGYSPERINPGDRKHTVENIIKIVSGSNLETLDFIDRLYSSVLKGGTCRAPSIRVAEAAKVVENTQRDVNIALMNELCSIFRAMDIPTNDVLKCASTKWNFMPVKPGLVGGHCIGVDPYYLIHGAWANGVYPRLIMDARVINENMAKYVSEALIQKMINHKIHIVDSKILILGFAFKPDCPDIRNTKVADVHTLFRSFTQDVYVYDPQVNRNEVQKQYGVSLVTDIDALRGTFDAILLCVGHKEFRTMDLRSLLNGHGILFDAMNVLPDADYYL